MTQTPFKRGKCTSKGFKIVTRWKCVDVRIKDGIDRQNAERAMYAEKHFNACQFCRYFVPDGTTQPAAPAAPAAAPPKNAEKQNAYAQTNGDEPDEIDLF